MPGSIARRDTDGPTDIGRTAEISGVCVSFSAVAEAYRFSLIGRGEEWR
jgi:hypothetical protein